MSSRTSVGSFVRRFRLGRTVGATQWSVSLLGKVILIGFHSNSTQVPTGAERGQDQRRDHVEPLRPGYEVRHGRSVSARSSDGRLGADGVRMSDSKLTEMLLGINRPRSAAVAAHSRRSCISSCLGFVAVRNSCGVSGKGLPCRTSLCPAAVYWPRLAALSSAACRDNSSLISLHRPSRRNWD